MAVAVGGVCEMRRLVAALPEMGAALKRGRQVSASEYETSTEN